MEMILKSGEKVYDANAVLKAGGGYEVTVGEKPFPQPEGELPPPIIDHRQYDKEGDTVFSEGVGYRVMRVSNKFYVKAGAETFEFEKWEKDDLFDLIHNAAALGKSEVYPPMPGSVVAVLAENGAKVKRGDKIMVIEAMKMETTLVAELDGILRGISLEVGDRFDSDTMLFSIGKDRS